MNWCSDIELYIRVLRLEIGKKVLVVKIKLIYVWYVIWWRETMITYLENIVCECYVWMEGSDESVQACLLTFSEILGRSMKELGSGFFIEIVVLDVS